MAWNIKIDPADKVFSQYIRLRDKKCMRCGSAVKLNDKGLPVSHQASHYFGRGREGTRFEPDNVDCLCGACHLYWGSTNHEAYREYKIAQLGEFRHSTLMLQANAYCKKDRVFSLIVAKQLLKGVSS